LKIDVIAAPVRAGTHQPNRLRHRCDDSIQPCWRGWRTTATLGSGLPSYRRDTGTGSIYGKERRVETSA
jgi:hypothetical protein